MQADQSSATAPPCALLPPKAERSSYRHKIAGLSYVNLDQYNGGILRDVSPAGIAIQAVTPLDPLSPVYVRFELFHPRTRIEAAGRVVWSNRAGEAGIQFTGLGPSAHKSLTEWMFSQLLSASTDRSLFQAAAAQQFHSTPRLSSKSDSTRPLWIPWWPVPISAGMLGKTIDSLLILCSVLVFCLIFISVTQVFPSWWISLPVCSAAGMFFSVFYWSLFSRWGTGTPGALLAGVALRSNQNTTKINDAPRFR
jgi:hypothetical protein